MANDFTMGFKTPGFDEVLGKFDKLTKKEQLAIAKGSKLARTFDKVGKSGKGAGQSGTKYFSDMTRTLTGVFSAATIVNKAFQGLNAELARIKQRQKEAFQAQGGFVQARQNFIANNQAALLQDPGIVKRASTFAKSRGKLLGKGGAANVLRAITSVRSAIGTTATEKQQLAAIDAGVIGKVLDPSANITQLATANLRTQQQLGISRTKAQNVISTFGEFAGGDINQFVGEFGKLSGLASATKSKFTDVLALEGVISQASGLGPEQVTTILSQALGKLSSRQPKGVKLKAQDAVGRLIEISQRATAGEFGAKKSKVLSEAGLEGGRGPQITGAIAENLDQLNKARRDIFKISTSNIDLQQRSLALLGPKAKKQFRVTRAEGEADVSKIEGKGGDKEASVEEKIRIFNALRKTYNLPDIFGVSEAKIRYLGASVEDVLAPAPTRFSGPEPQSMKDLRANVREAVETGIVDGMQKVITDITPQEKVKVAPEGE